MGESRRISVHQALGGGASSDVLLWKKWFSSVTVLVSASALWFLFERAGYNLLSFIANVLFLLVVILFLWAKSATLLNRPLPPLPDLEISEESVFEAADIMGVWINKALLVAREITIGGNLYFLLKVALCLWLISYIGCFFNFLTMVYIGILVSLSIPFLYDKYQDRIDDKFIVVHKIVQTQYKRIDDSILSRIPKRLNKDKKTQ